MTTLLNRNGFLPLPPHQTSRAGLARALSGALNDRLLFGLNLKDPSDFFGNFPGVLAQDRGKVALVRNRSVDCDQGVNRDRAS